MYHIFPHYLINGTILAKSYWAWNVCFDLLYNSVWNITDSKNNSMRYYRTCPFVFMQNTCYTYRTVIKPEFSRQIIEKYSQIKFHENPSSRSRIVLSEQTDRHGKVMSNKCRRMRAVCYSSQCVVTHYTLLSKLNFTSDDSLCWLFYWNYQSYSLRMALWGLKHVEWYNVLKCWCCNNKCVQSSAFILYCNINARIWAM